MTYMVRATARPSSPAHALEQLASVYGAHQAVWSLFSDGPDRRRDFLYRIVEDAPLKVYAVSARPPTAHPAWSSDVREFAPNLQAGDVLRFSLRANATKRTAEPGRRSDGKRHDVVMDAKRRAREQGEARSESDLVHEAGLSWLTRQGAAHGFALLDGQVAATSHRTHEFHKPGRPQPLRISGIDFDGLLRVEDPDAFHRALREGIGPAKGFGFGLLLVRRA